MKRIVVIGLVALACAVSFVVGGAVALDAVSRRTSHRVHLREAQWKNDLDHEVRIGEPKSEVEAWIVHRTRFRVDDAYDATERKFFLIADTITDPIGFPCDTWMIAVKVSLGPDDRVVSRGVRPREPASDLRLLRVERRRS